MKAKLKTDRSSILKYDEKVDEWKVSRPLQCHLLMMLVMLTANLQRLLFSINVLVFKLLSFSPEQGRGGWREKEGKSRTAGRNHAAALGASVNLFWAQNQSPETKCNAQVQRGECLHENWVPDRVSCIVRKYCHCVVYFLHRKDTLIMCLSISFISFCSFGSPTCLFRNKW